MRLVDCHQVYVELFYALAKQLCTKSFGRKVEKLNIAVGTIVEQDVLLVSRKPGMNGLCLNSTAFELLHLVLHQSNQRSDYQADALLGKRRNLKSDGLTAACRHKREGVYTRINALNNLPLHRAERGVTPIALQYLLKLVQWQMRKNVRSANIAQILDYGKSEFRTTTEIRQ